MSFDHPDLDAVRRQLNHRQNHVIDEMRRGGLSRRDFLRAASVAGIGLPLAGLIAGPAMAAKKKAPTKAPKKGTPTTAAKAQTQLRLGVIAPGSKIDPVIANNGGALLVLGLAGEYLAFSNNDLILEPRVAQSWSASADSTRWTFTIRKGIKFHNGQTHTADDVVATFDRLADPANKSNALSVFKGVLSKGNIKKVDANTVTFQLDIPVGSFPYLVSSDNYNCIILPANYAGDWETTFEGSGPWVKEKYVVDQGVTFVKNPNYWNKAHQSSIDRLVLVQFKDDKAGLAQLQGGQLDGLSMITNNTAYSALKGDPNYAIETPPSTGHLQVHLRSDKGPFADKRLRQAFALTLDRPGIITGVADGLGVQGNDSPMAPAYPTTDKSVAQRAKDLAKAKALMTAAGKPDGFEVTLSSWDRGDIKLLAQIAQAAAKDIGIKVNLDIVSAGDYYDDKRSPSWLNSDFGITEYGHRGVPNVYLNAAYKTGGVWNAAHYSSPDLDASIKTFVESADPATQKAASKKIQETLLEDSPVVTAIFGSAIQITKKNVTGLVTTGMNHIDTGKAAIS